MNLNLINKVYIISGSSRGIGKGIAEVLLLEGANVVLTGRDQDSLEATFKALYNKFSGCVIGCTGDLNTDATLDEIEKLVMEKWSRIDGVIANAGSIKPVEDWDIPETDWDWYFTSNFKIAVRFITKFIPQLKKTNGSITIISSIAGVEEIGAPMPYSASKAALTMYSKGLARKLASDYIRVNTVAPGNIIFPGGNWDKKKKANPVGIQKILDENVPQKRFGKPEDIGNIVAFLASEKAAFITGSCFVVDGGQTSLFI